MSVRGDPGLTSLAPRAPPGRPRRAARSVDRARASSFQTRSPLQREKIVARSRPADPLPRRALSSPQGGKAEEVTWEDQQHICAFGRFNTRVHEVNAELRAKAVRARNQHLRRRFVGVEKKALSSLRVFSRASDLILTANPLPSSSLSLSSRKTPSSL